MLLSSNTTVVSVPLFFCDFNYAALYIWKLVLMILFWHLCLFFTWKMVNSLLLNYSFSLLAIIIKYVNVYPARSIILVLIAIFNILIIYCIHQTCRMEHIIWSIHHLIHFYLLLWGCVIWFFYIIKEILYRRFWSSCFCAGQKWCSANCWWCKQVIFCFLCLKAVDMECYLAISHWWFPCFSEFSDSWLMVFNDYS